MRCLSIAELTVSHTSVLTILAITVERYYAVRIIIIIITIITITITITIIVIIITIIVIIITTVSIVIVIPLFPFLDASASLAFTLVSQFVVRSQSYGHLKISTVSVPLDRHRASVETCDLPDI